MDRILDAVTIDDWPNIILFGLMACDVDRIVLRLSWNLCGPKRVIDTRALKQESVRHVNGTSITVRRLTDTTFPLLVLDVNQDFDALSCFIKNYVNCRSILHQHTRHVIIVNGMERGESSKINLLMRRICEEYSHNAIFVFITCELNHVSRGVQSKCVALNLRQKTVTTVPNEIMEFLKGIKLLKLLKVTRSEAERHCKTMNGFVPQLCLRGVAEVVDVSLAAHADHMLKLTGSWSNVSRYVTLHILARVQKN